MFGLSVFKRDRTKSVVALKIPQGGNLTTVSLSNSMDSQSLSLSTEQLVQSVKLPKNEDKNDWIATHVIDFYNKLVLLAQSVQPICTEQSCAVMGSGAGFEYRWVDKKSKDYAKPTQVSAPLYQKLLFAWLQKYTSDERYFPSDEKSPYSKKFPELTKKMFARMFRVFAHIYSSHLQDAKKAGVLAHLNTCFKHYVLFSFEFDMIPKEELVPMNAVIVQLLGEDFKKKLHYK